MSTEISKGYHPHRDSDQLVYHIHTDAHRYTSSLADVILGGQDGLVNVLGIVLGVAAATHDARIVLVAGLAATFAESISMAAVAYTSSLAETAHYESELEREYRHVRMVPAVEKGEIREIYQQKGWKGKAFIVSIVEQSSVHWQAGSFPTKTVFV